MSHVFLDVRNGARRLYLNGDLQFDSRDERLYHEPLGLVPVALARGRAPGRALRVLILGGGDGLALREVLKFAEVAEAHVVDRDAEVLRLGAGPLASLNGGAFRDPRARLHVREARAFLGRARGFDALIYDLTYPGDVAGAALFDVPSLRRARAALRPGGILAVNAVSPEATPQAFGCIGRTLGAVGLAAVPYAFVLPSFVEEGYGRWGFFFASSRPIRLGELRGLRLPEGSRLGPEALVAGTRLPAAAGPAMRAAPNASTELLYYLHNPTPLSWQPPWRPLRFAAATGGRGPRPTAAQGFARWLRAPAGRRSLEELLACVPLTQRGQTREAFLEWSDQAEILFREVDLRAFVERTLQRAAGLPATWIRELRRLRERIRDGLPPMGELLEQAYRVFAIYLLVLLLANLFFPDNLYAKGGSYSGSRSSFSSSSGDSPFYGFHFSDPGARYAPYHYRPLFSRSYGPRPAGAPAEQVYDPEGRAYPALRFAFTDPRGGMRPVASLLALGPELQLLDTGGVACASGLPGYQCLLEPGHVRVLDAAGREVLALRPPARVQQEAATRLAQQGPLIDRALADHRRWLEWVHWGSMLPQGQEAVSELAVLEGLKRVVETAQAPWRQGTPSPAFDPPAGWTALFPGIYLERARFAGQDPTLVLVGSDGTPRRQPVDPPPRLTDADRFLFRVLHRRLTEGRDQTLAVPVSRWIQLHGAELGVPPGTRS